MRIGMGRLTLVSSINYGDASVHSVEERQGSRAVAGNASRGFLVFEGCVFFFFWWAALTILVYLGALYSFLIKLSYL
jgi:hypothetical protein